MAQSTMTFTWGGGTRAEFGRQLVVNIKRDSQSYRHVLSFFFNDTPIETQYGVTNMAVCDGYEQSLMQKIPNNTQGTAKVICYTYDGPATPGNPGTFIGQQTKTDTIYVPDDVKPTISGVELSDPTGYLGTYGAYVCKQSKIRAVITASASQYSLINQYKVSIGTVYVSDNELNDLTIEELGLTGTVNVTSTVVDTRNRSSQVTQQIEVVPYSAPDTSGSTAKRWNTSTNDEDDESSTVRVRATGSVFDVNGKGINSGTAKIETSLYGSGSWTTRDTRAVGPGPFDYAVDVTGMDTNQRYQTRITVTDSFGTETVSVMTVETAQPVMDLRSNGKGVAFFGVSNADGLKVYGNENVTGSISVEGSHTVGGRSNLNGGVYVGNGVISGRNNYGDCSGERIVIEVAKSQLTYNNDGNNGYFRMYGSIGGWESGNSGAIDIRIPFRNLSDVSQVDVTSYSANIPEGNAQVDVYRDASGYIHVYLTFTDFYWALSLCFEGRQCDFLWNKYSVGQYDTSKYNGTRLFGGSAFCPSIFPVGTVLIRYDHRSPAEFFHGTWMRISGTFLYATGASGTIGATGGSSTHTLTTAQMPSHNHGMNIRNTSHEASNHGTTYVGSSGPFANRVMVYLNGANESESYTTYTGSGQAHNNNPYFTNVSVWRRIA